MKKFNVFAIAVILVLCGASPLFAGGAVNKNNLSAEYIRTMNRAAATDSADIVAYNPAGVMALDNGLLANFSFQYIDKEYENVKSGATSPGTYTSTEPSIIPELYVVYKKDKWAGFFGFNIPIGGGKVEYPNGNATTIRIKENFLGTGPMKLEAESYAFGYTIGGAYQINNKYAVSLGLRYIDSEKWLNGTAPAQFAAPIGAGNATAEYEATATGWGGIIGLDIFVNKDLTVGFKYETKTSLKYTYNHQSGTNAKGTTVLNALGVTNGGEAHEDLPALFSVGVSYKLTPKLRVEPTFTYYFNEDADLGGISNSSKNLEDRIGNGYDIGFAVEYAFTDTLKASVGILWTDTGVDANDMVPEAPELDAFSMCTGLAWQARPDLEVNFGIGKVNYLGETTSSTATYKNVEYSKNVVQMGLGVQYKFF